ncbi:probable ATP-dependent RNA helicase DHX58 [Rhinatrema bivittatum]|uniref:probable ATP-dependent RNA helicase DHX58 n=1 Tax=Rhinatrema bivittatum TaxID=194408 RepID=UPI0011260757|nr:probable ATP-dependent RNA helicase DHX58 [Rhinatrema bivittatum]
MNLHDYQWEVIEPALEGKNIIIWLPTGSGKTRAALYVAKRHLETRRKAKVAVLVNKVHLVDQHCQKEFKPFLGDSFKIVAISGDNDEKSFFANAVETHDVVICTAQILQNALTTPEEEKHVELTDFSLLIIDECHHTHKDGVYNKLMEGYIEKKLKRQGRLPQILGLTASPGTGKATTFEKAKEHILQICANLDTWKIMSPKNYQKELETKTHLPKKNFDLTMERPQDPFGCKLTEIMRKIHEFLDDPSISSEFGTQRYEQNIVQLEKEGAVTFNSRKRICALHLRKYNDALFIHDTVRRIDAFNYLDEFYVLEKAHKTGGDPTEEFLFQVFAENKEPLLLSATNVKHENPKLSKLEEILQEQFETSAESRGIVFTKTRQCAHSLQKWVESNEILQAIGIKAAVLTGAGYSNQTKHMTQNNQQDVIQKFRKGALNLLISTSVAEEGLDIPECNIVVRYGLMTNEIAMVQARGRARADNSVYSVLAKLGSKEVQREKINESLEELMKKAIEEVQRMPEEEYRQKIFELQTESIISRKLKQEQQEYKKQKYLADEVLLYCRNCSEPVCHGSDLRTIEKTHHVNINPNFKIYYNVSPERIVIPKKMEDWIPGGEITCLCGQKWGMEMIYKAVSIPNIGVKNFVVETPDEKRTYKKWKDVPFSIEEFNYMEYCQSHFPDLDVTC